MTLKTRLLFRRFRRKPTAKTLSNLVSAINKNTRQPNGYGIYLESNENGTQFRVMYFADSTMETYEAFPFTPIAELHNILSCVKEITKC